MGELTRVRVGVVSWNVDSLLDDCLRSLPPALAGLNFEVVVVDNASSDRSLEIARSHSFVRVEQNSENLGYARAMNQALRAPSDQGTPEVLVALNPDTVLPPGGLTQLVSVLSEHEDVGLVVPKLLHPDGSTQHSIYLFPRPAVSLMAGLLPLRFQHGRLADRWCLEPGTDHDRPRDIEWAIGAVHVIRASAVQDRGPYEERWFMYIEDLDLCWQLAHAGWRRRLLPQVRVRHIGNASGAKKWGANRASQWIAAEYDWYRWRHGKARTRLWAAANLAGASAHLPSVVARRVRGRSLEQWQSDLVAIAPFHLSNLWRLH